MMPHDASPDGFLMGFAIIGCAVALLLLVIIAPEFYERSVRWMTSGGCALLARMGSGVSRAMVDIHGEPVQGKPSVRSVLATWWSRAHGAFHGLAARVPLTTLSDNDRTSHVRNGEVTP